MMTLRKTAIVTLSAALLSAAGLPATAADTLRVGWTTSDSAQDPYAIMAHNLKAELEERLPGKFDVQMFPNNQLGDEKQMLEDLITAAFNDARSKADEVSNTEMGKMTAGLPLPPGFKLPF